jgi:adaptin ear-binding coat-associated protein 1/2
METIDPATGKPLPADAIQRVLFIAPSVHIYNIPPLTSTKGYVAASWTSSPSRHIFTARLRILETAVPGPLNPASPSATDEESVKTDVLLEDPSTGQLFAAAPYTSASVVEQVLDSSRFFAVRVQDERGRKAVLGIGFEERGEAFDFSVALQEVEKTLGLETKPVGGAGKKGEREREREEKRDFSLKDGETITVNIGARSKGRRSVEKKDIGAGGGDGGAFSLPPPPYSGVLLPPPPSAQEVKKKRLSQTVVVPEPASMEDLGFDDGEFGEFQ